MQKIWAEHALMPSGWQKKVLITICDMGHIKAVQTNIDKPKNEADIFYCGVLLPAPANIHSHGFQRAIAGMTERRGGDSADNFWAWRKLMYRFLCQLTPEDIETITAFVQMEMLEAGFAASTEFHYLHHQSDGTPYNNIAELSGRVINASHESGIGLTLLPVLYEQGGCDGRKLGKGQLRFGNNIDRFERLVESANATISKSFSDARIGVAPHSLRAVSRESLSEVIKLRPDDVVHIHLAEQIMEVDEVIAAYGKRPVEWLFDNHEISERWCLIHLTQMQPHETISVAQSRAVAGLCPITEANLGDGIFDAIRFLENKGRFAIGSDSNIRISLSEELRSLEYSQRLIHHARAALTQVPMSNGRTLFEGAIQGGAQASARKSGSIDVGNLADLMALDNDHVNLSGYVGDMILDSFIFVGDRTMISDVWAAGRHMVRDGRHIRYDSITAKYKACMRGLKDCL